MSKLSIAAFAASPSAKTYKFQTLVCRKISTKDDEEKGFVTYVGQAPVESFVELPEKENVREYIPGSGQRMKKSSVHMAIEDTLQNRPELFSALNGGIVIVAEAIEMLEDQRLIMLTNPSIINGSQTRGVIKELSELCREGETLGANAKFELIVTKNKELSDDVSIARNFQIMVKSISILGKRGYFDEMAENFRDYSGQKRKIRKSETDRDEEFIPTEKLIQVITALIPESLWPSARRSGEPWNKAFAYSSAQGPLKLFESAYDRAKGINGAQVEESAEELYKFFIEIASPAWELYEKWSKHSGFKGTNLRKGITRDEKNNILHVMDGIIFPILASFSVFTKKQDDKWGIFFPAKWDDNFIIQQAKGQFTSAADSNPQTMGKTAGIYQSLQGITSMTLLMG